MESEIVVATLSGSILVIVCGLASWMDMRSHRQPKLTKQSE
jgi:hypothetical protein